MAGKGDRPRPRSVDREEYERRWEQIDWREDTASERFYFTASWHPFTGEIRIEADDTEVGS